MLARQHLRLTPTTTTRHGARRGVAVCSAQPLRRASDSVLQTVQVLKQTTATQRAVGTAVGGLAAAALVRWQAVLSAALSPALLVASLGWVLAHESRASLEEDVSVLLFPGRRWRRQGVEADAPDGYEADGEEDELLVPPCDDAGGVYTEEFLLWTNQDAEDFSEHRGSEAKAPARNGPNVNSTPRKGKKQR